MNWYFVYLTREGRLQQWGWMLALDDMELIDYAQSMNLGIDITFLGKADMQCTFPKVKGQEVLPTLVSLGPNNPLLRIQ